MKTVIAEKPSVGKELAHFLGATQQKDGYLEGNGYYVTWAYGHLFEIKDMTELGFNGVWDIENLPFIPDNYTLKLKSNSGVRKQYNVISELINKSSEIVCATDAGREGELIFRYIYDYTKCSIPIKRLWCSSLTNEALSKAFSSLKPGTDYNNLYNAAKSRNQADYLVGLNATIALTSKANIGLLSLGRVQTPTLAIICQRYLENTNFTPTPYYNIKVKLIKDSNSFFATSVDNWEEKNTAQEVFSKIEKALTATVVKVEKNEKREQPPLLFDLTSLQQEANKKHSFTANQTLELAQSLYESKYITYPRTGSCYIGDDIYMEIPGLIQSLQKYTHNNFNEVPKDLHGKTLNKKSVNKDKVTDHHALLTTGIIPTNFISESHRIIYELVAGRMLEAFSQVCIKDVTKIELEIDKYFFQTTGTQIKEFGWRKIRNEKNEEESILLPIIQEGETLNKIENLFQELFTKPKPLHTEASILQAMETCGKSVDDETLKEALKENGIGTPATRASILEILIKRDYIARDKKSLIPTDIGLQVYDLVKDIDISKADLTGQWENKLLRMERGEYNYISFNKEIEEYTKNLISLLKSIDVNIKKKSIGNCPRCNGEIIESPKAFSCENKKLETNSCSFPVIWKVIGKKQLSLNSISELITKGKTGIIKNFKSKEDKSFDAALLINQDKIVYDFSTDEIDTCPKCKKGKIKETSKSFSCSGYKEGCDFTIWKVICGKTISLSIVKQLLQGKETNIIKGFTSKTSKFDAALILDKDFKTAFSFNKK